MPIFRLYSGSDGQSHLEELSFSFMPGEVAEQVADADRQWDFLQPDQARRL